MKMGIKDKASLFRESEEPYTQYKMGHMKEYSRISKDNPLLAGTHQHLNEPLPIFSLTVQLDSLHMSVSTRSFSIIEAAALLVGLERIIRLVFVAASIVFIHPMFMR